MQGMQLQTTAKIGFVGLGHMGGGMVGRLLQAGHAVYGTSLRREGAEALIEDGLQWRDTAREVAQAADVVFTSLPDDRAVEDVAAGQTGIFAGLTAEKIWVDVSTISPRASRDLAALFDVLDRMTAHQRVA